MDIARLYRDERPRALATLIRLLGDFDLAEEALQEAFTTALERWPGEGAPSQPLAWLVSTARHKAIDRQRRRSRFEAKHEAIAASLVREARDADLAAAVQDGPLADDALRLIFTCCHPALAPEAQVALTLKTLCGLSVDEIARAFLVPEPTLAQRLARAKAKIRAAGIPYQVPEPAQLRERLDGVLRVVYLVFNEGYAPTSGHTALRIELCAEAIRLARLLRELLPRTSEVGGLLALLLLQDSRRAARFDATGEIVTLEAQDRSLWDRGQIDEGLRLAERALREGGAGFYALQSAIAALHAQVPTPEATDWRQIAILYALLLRAHPSPVVALNHAVAVGMAEGPARGLELIAEIETRGLLPRFHLLPAAKAELLRRLGRNTEASDAYRQALQWVGNEAERRYLQRRLGELTSIEPSCE